MTTTITVSSCATCPFYRLDTAICADSMHSGRLVQQAPTLPPPDWCPLRESDRVVTLRVK